MEVGPNTELEKVKRLVSLGHQLKDALRAVYGEAFRLGTYYDITTPEQRKEIYCRPVPIGPICTIKIRLPIERRSSFAELAKSKNKSVSELLNTLIIETLTLNKL